jgi:hypothetical protein
VQRPGPRLERALEREVRALGLGVEMHVRDLDPHAARAGDPPGVDLEVGGVQDELVERLADLERDVLRARERRGVEIGLEHQVVPRRDRAARQAIPRLRGFRGDRHDQAFT